MMICMLYGLLHFTAAALNGYIARCMRYIDSAPYVSVVIDHTDHHCTRSSNKLML